MCLSSLQVLQLQVTVLLFQLKGLDNFIFLCPLKHHYWSDLLFYFFSELLSWTMLFKAWQEAPRLSCSRVSCWICLSFSIRDSTSVLLNWPFFVPQLPADSVFSMCISNAGRIGTMELTHSRVYITCFGIAEKESFYRTFGLVGGFQI